ncbi:perosamine synthetase [Thalassotalea sp. M1531]|uniref:Perosamine synthetase n=2 Tax=Thalassotalea algicola TaxID=2716224 RepID=A0A7Y0LFU1_9GAMM|nr:perosamine synthetase [Thalassotalea algicola]
MHSLSQEIATLCQRDSALMTSSGSAALIAALKALDIPNGAEVIMPAICCPAVLFAIQMAGYSPVLADVSLTNFSMNTAEVKAVVTKQSAAVVAVHGYGHYCEIDKLVDYCKSQGLLLIEDACLAMGGSFKNKALGSFGDISIVSFGYDKVIACQYGGALLTNNEKLKKRAQEFLNQNEFFRYNDSPSLLGQLKNELDKLDDYIAKRQEHAKTCQEKLTNPSLVKAEYNSDVLYWRYPLLIQSDRDEFIAKAKNNDILITCHYKSLQLLKTEGFLPNAQKVSEQVINIFIRPETDQEKMLATINFINEHA